MKQKYYLKLCLKQALRGGGEVIIQKYSMGERERSYIFDHSFLGRGYHLKAELIIKAIV